MNESSRQRTDWKALISAAGLFWVIVGTILALHDNYMLSLMDKRINEHAASARDNRDSFYRDIQQRADGSASRIGSDITELKSNCAVMQKWATGVDSELAGLNHWRSECSQKMARVQQYMERDSSDIRDLEQEIKDLQDMERNEHRGIKR